MRILRPALALAATVSLVGGVVSAQAATKPICNQVTDDTGDAGVITEQSGMDIATADITSDSKNLTAVIRLSGPPKGANPEAAGGTRYYFNYNLAAASNVQYLTASVPLSGAPTFRTGQVVPTGGQNVSTDDAAGSAVGSIKGNVITISTPISGLARGSVKPGTKLTNLLVEVRVLVGPPGGPGLLVLADDASASKAYVAGTKTCVKPGQI